VSVLCRASRDDIYTGTDSGSMRTGEESDVTPSSGFCTLVDEESIVYEQVHPNDG